MLKVVLAPSGVVWEYRMGETARAARRVATAKRANVQHGNRAKKRGRKCRSIIDPPVKGVGRWLFLFPCGPG
jgi:hypothetical protein